MAEKPKGATIVKSETVNEAGAKLSQIKKQNSFDEFVEAKRIAETENLKPLSGDLEVMTNVDDTTLMKLQGRASNGKLLPDGVGRLHGWDPKTRIALVLKMAFLEKQKKNKGE